jgi:hypothetical protein
MNEIIKLLDRRGPGLTSDLAATLRSDGLSADAARKRLSRLPPEVNILRGIRFPKRARFIYLQDQFGTNEYWNALIEAVENTNSAYAAALAGLQARQGIVPLSHFPIISGAPIRQKGHLSHEVVLEGLLRIGLVDRYTVESIGECVALSSIVGDVSDRTLRARLLTEDILLDAVKSWAGKLNLASPNSLRTRGRFSIPNFSTFAFDMTGPSYLSPIRRKKKDGISPGFLTVDVTTGLVLTPAHVRPFLKKCQSLLHLRTIRPFIPMLIADGFEENALHELRAAGVMATTPSTLFGDDVGRALKDLFQTLTNAAAVAAAEPDKLENLFSKLSKIEGAATNLRGALFELIVGHMVREQFGGSIDIGKPVYDKVSKQGREIDVLQVVQRKVGIYECRGYQPNALIGVDQIETWLTKKVPIIFNALHQEERFAGARLRFEFWTTGGFHPDAVAIFREAKRRTKKYDLVLRDGGAVKKFATGMSAPGALKILNEHYFKHPLREVTVIPGKPDPTMIVTPVRMRDILKEDDEDDLEAVLF